MYDSTATTKSYTWTAVKNDSETATVNGYANLTDSVNVKVFDAIPALSIVNIYVYYEGEDTNCVTNNTVDGIDTLTVEISFKAYKPVA